MKVHIYDESYEVETVEQAAALFYFERCALTADAVLPVRNDETGEETKVFCRTLIDAKRLTP